MNFRELLGAIRLIGISGVFRAGEPLPFVLKPDYEAFAWPPEHPHDVNGGVCCGFFDAVVEPDHLPDFLSVKLPQTQQNLLQGLIAVFHLEVSNDLPPVVLQLGFSHKLLSGEGDAA